MRRTFIYLVVSIVFRLERIAALAARRSSSPAAFRRQFLDQSAYGLFTVGLVSSPIAAAATVIDIQRYGDKELKIATINKLKQLLRNSLLQTPAQASPFLKLALADSLTFNSMTREGGPDGAIQFDSGALENNPELASALLELKRIKKQLAKTTEVSLADVLQLAGAEAIEACGGPRIQVFFPHEHGTEVYR